MHKGAPTPLEIIMRERIAQDGALGIDDFMALALSHPDHGYYMKQDPFGAAGDFTTAPEISQMFGEILGAWVADVWIQMGRPDHFTFIECGPGRGTLMADMMRATRHVPGFHAAARIHLMEISPVLKQSQSRALSAYNPRWIEGLSDVPGDDPAIIIANEFLDALPIRQIVKTKTDWCERCIVVDESENFAFDTRPLTGDHLTFPPASPGDIFEFSPAREGFVSDVCHLLRERSGAALFIDYGHLRTAPGDTLQAVRRHDFTPVLSHIGDADITSHVDFEALATVARRQGGEVSGLTTQGDFLVALGIAQRAQALQKSADPAQVDSIQKALHRLCDSGQMGALFKVMGLHNAKSPRATPLRPAGFSSHSTL